VLVTFLLVLELGLFYLIVPFLLRFGGISGTFGEAMVGILARRSWVKRPMARPNELDIPPKHDKKSTIRYLPYPNLAK